MMMLRMLCRILFLYIIIFIITNSGIWQLLAPAPIRAEADSSESLRGPAPRPAAPAASGAPAAGEIFRRHCAKCHTADGKGNEARDRFPEIPDFTDASWQTTRTDAELLASILNGMEPEMPGWRGRISQDQADGLVAYVRAFASTEAKLRQGEQDQPDGVESASAGADAPRSLVAKLVRWLGKSHPAAVHFPIALLMAAAVAELLRMATGNSALDTVSRFCVWLGTVAAVVAGVLGWFVGGFRLTDLSWVLTTHRWLGTSTVACALLVLALSEVSRRPDRRRTRICYRVVLLVVAALVSVTGFFGGAVVFGIDHYAWPR